MYFHLYELQSIRMLWTDIVGDIAPRITYQMICRSSGEQCPQASKTTHLTAEAEENRIIVLNLLYRLFNELHNPITLLFLADISLFSIRCPFMNSATGHLQVRSVPVRLNASTFSTGAVPKWNTPSRTRTPQDL
jgi:hypothetical protein